MALVCMPILAVDLKINELPSDHTFTTSSSTLELSGKLSDPLFVQRFEWTTASGERSSIEPASDWRALGIPLVPGPNRIVVTATDRTGVASQQLVLVVRTSIPGHPLPVEEGVIQWRGQPVSYRIENGLAIAFGDVILGTAEEVRGSNAVRGS